MLKDSFYLNAKKDMTSCLNLKNLMLHLNSTASFNPKILLLIKSLEACANKMLKYITTQIISSTTFDLKVLKDHA